LVIAAPGQVAEQQAVSVVADLPHGTLRSGQLRYGEPFGHAALVDAFLREARLSSSRPQTGPAFRTILFTDVVSSTPLLTQLRDQRMREVMRDHDAVMTAAVTGHGGRIVKTIGDAFMAEFAVPSAAVEAAIEAQRQIREKFAASDIPLRVRIGINAGEPIEEAGDLHGASVVIAKRLESAAETSGILVSDVVKQAVAGKEFVFEDRGLVELKGFEEPVRAWAVRWE
jgi:class 3 adenylate cyclase